MNKDWQCCVFSSKAHFSDCDNPTDTHRAEPYEYHYTDITLINNSDEKEVMSTQSYGLSVCMDAIYLKNL